MWNELSEFEVMRCYCISIYNVLTSRTEELCKVARHKNVISLDYLYFQWSTCNLMMSRVCPYFCSTQEYTEMIYKKKSSR